MAQLSIRVMGPFQVNLDGKPVSGFASDKVRALLAYLVLSPDESHRREALAGLLWPEFPERSARTNLRNALANLRYVIRDSAATPPFLQCTRQTIQFNSQSDYWLDADAFEDLLAFLPSTSLELEQAVRMVRGIFLEGFSLADAVPFEEWLLLRREHYCRQVVQALEHLASVHENLGSYEQALIHTRRRVEMEPWQEDGQRQLMRLLVRSGCRSEALAHYDAYRRMLAEELGVGPTPETTRLYEQIQRDELEFPTAAPALELRKYPPPMLPGFLEQECDAVETSVFVAREQELTRLQAHLDKMITGHGQVVFITGGPGRGKTALLAEFGRRAMGAYPDLLVASGNCNAYSGVGDPYLPFRDVMSMLTGDIEARWRTGEVSTKQAKRLWNTLPTTIQSLLHYGPQVVGPLVAEKALLSHTALWCAHTSAEMNSTAWFHQLRNRIERQGIISESSEQSHLFQQVANLFHNLSETHPLLLILDDLQWADTASIALLFHLGRQLKGSRVLIAGAYRPEELALDWGGKQRSRVTLLHPLEKVLAEFKRTYGDVWLDLGRQDPEEGREFVNALLDAEPNQLDEGFRQALYEHTGGYPLFAVELLRTMQERGDLHLDEHGQWVSGPGLNWDILPPRVEAVIEERIHRLDPELREILRVASVEGRIFTVQMVARVQDIHERHLLKRLSLDLEKRHRLVREAGEHRVGSRSLYRYQFVHHLFQRYLYHNVGAGELRLLHGAIGDVLAELYADRDDDIVVQLVYHYQQAGKEEVALPYLIRAGHKAREKFAHDEAVHYYTEALNIMLQDSSERYDLLASRAAIYGIVARRNEQRADVEAMLDLAEKLADNTRICDALLALADYHSETNHLDAQQPAQDALVVARKIRDPLREGHALRCLGTLEMRKGDNHRSREQLAAATEIFLNMGASREAATCLHQLSVTLARLGEHEPAIESAKKAVTLSREIGDQQQEATGARRVAIAYTVNKQPAEALPFARRALALHREVGDRSSECAALNVIGIIRTHMGEHADSEKHLRQSLKIAESIGSSQHTGYAAFNLVRLHYERLGDFEGCLRFLSTLLMQAKIEGDNWLEAFFCDEKGRTLMHLGQYDRAYRSLSTASRMMEELGDLWLGLPSSIWNGLVQAYLGDYKGAVKTLLVAAERARVARLDFESALALVVLGLAYLLSGRSETLLAGLERVQEGLDLMPDADILHSWCGIGYEIAAALYLKLGMMDKAMQYSTHGLRMMKSDPAPWWPERRHFTHSLILRATGQDVAADTHLKRAYARVMMIAENTKDQRLRGSWLEKVDVNQEILGECIQRGISLL